MVGREGWREGGEVERRGRYGWREGREIGEAWIRLEGGREGREEREGG